MDIAASSIPARDHQGCFIGAARESKVALIVKREVVDDYDTTVQLDSMATFEYLAKLALEAEDVPMKKIDHFRSISVRKMT